MLLDTITMDRTEARKAFLEYRHAVRDERRRPADQVRADEQIMRAYRELARGHQLIKLSQAIAAGGTTTLPYASTRWTGDGYVPVERTVELPLLAVARADSAYAYTHGISADGSLEIRDRETIAPHNQRNRIQLPEGTFPADRERRVTWGREVARALAPLIPPSLRPKRGHLGLYHVLWGPAEWAIHTMPPPPGDPALLRHIEGDLYAVVAVWDLTPVEQAVLGGLRG